MSCARKRKNVGLAAVIVFFLGLVKNQEA